MGEYFQSSTFRKYNVLNVLSFIQVNLAMSSHAAFLCLFVFWCRGMVAYAGVVCTTDAYCQSQSPLSSCKDGFCTNPYSSGCFPGAKRVCNSLDTKGSSERGECVPNELKYPEVRLFPHNWESAMFLTWTAQIYLSEVLHVPVTIETGSRQKFFEFYSKDNAFDYPSDAYDFGALKTAVTSNGACPSDSSVSCAHGMLEIWPSGQISPMETAFHLKDGYAEGMPNGAYGKISWYTFESLVAADPSLKSFYGFFEKEKMARTFKRPLSFWEYCKNVSLSANCTDSVASGLPSTAAESASYYLAGKYKGHFVADNCTESSSDCGGYFIQAPCDWVTWVDAQIKYSGANGTAMPLKTKGPQEDGGYSYGQMTQVIEAAGQNDENVLVWWWEPEALLERYKLESKWQMTSVILKDFSRTCQQSRPSRKKTCGTNSTARAGTNSNGGCDWPVELLTKALSTGLKNQEKNTDSFATTPARRFLSGFRVSTEKVSEVLFNWRWSSDGTYPTALRARKEVCTWLQELKGDFAKFVPEGYPKNIENVPIPNGFIAIIVLNCIGIALCLFIAFLLWGRRAEFKSSQPEFLVIALVGASFFYIFGILRASKPTNVGCAAEVWFANLGWSLFLVTLLLKELRVRELYRAAEKFKKSRLSVKMVRKLLAFWMFFSTFLLSLLSTLVHPSEAVLEYIPSSADAHKLLKYELCSTRQHASTGWNTVSFILNSMVILAGVILAIQTKTIDSRFSESRVIAAIMYNTFVTSLFVAGIYVVAGSSQEAGAKYTTQFPHVLTMAEAICINFGTSINVALLFVPKLLRLAPEMVHDLEKIIGTVNSPAKSHAKAEPSPALESEAEDGEDA